jgi:hypothetical protein
MALITREGTRASGDAVDLDEGRITAVQAARLISTCERRKRSIETGRSAGMFDHQIAGGALPCPSYGPASPSSRPQSRGPRYGWRGAILYMCSGPRSAWMRRVPKPSCAVRASGSPPYVSDGLCFFSAAGRGPGGMANTSS